MNLIFFIFLLPIYLYAGKWSSTDGKTTISLEPQELNVGEKTILRIETQGTLVDKDKLSKSFLDPLNGYIEKLKIDSIQQEKNSLTMVLVPLVDGEIPFHLEKIPLTDGKSIEGKILQIKVNMPATAIHNLLTIAAKPFPLDHHPIVDISADNRFLYVNGEIALEKEKALQTKMFLSKKVPIGKFIYILMSIALVVACYYFRREVAEWLKAKIIPPYNPLRHAQRSIHAAQKLYGHDARFFVSVSDALRRYFGELLALDVDDLTTQELVARFDKAPEISKEALKDLSGILHQADLVKFARASPSEEDIEETASQAMALIVSLESEKKIETS